MSGQGPQQGQDGQAEPPLPNEPHRGNHAAIGRAKYTLTTEHEKEEFLAELFRKDAENPNNGFFRRLNDKTEAAMMQHGADATAGHQNPSGLNDEQIRVLAQKQPNSVQLLYHTFGGLGKDMIQGGSEEMTPETIKAVDEAASKPPQAGQAVNADKVTKATTGKPTILHHDSTQSRPFRGAGPSQ